MSTDPRDMSLVEFIEAFEGRQLNYVERYICDTVDRVKDMKTALLMLSTRPCRRIVPRALTDVQRRGGRGTP